MLTTPARSLQRPPRPASPIGMASAMAAVSAPDESMSSAPVITRTVESTTIAPPMTANQNQRARWIGRRGGGGASRPVVMTSPWSLMPGPPRSIGVKRRTSWGASCRRPFLLGRGRSSGRELRGDPPLLHPDPGPPDQLVGDDDGQDDDTLDDQDEAVGDAGVDLQTVALGVEIGPQQRREDDADGVVAAEQRDGDAGEPETGLEGVAVCVVLPEEQRHPDQAGGRSGDDHRGE